jgi:hypothetical protein
LAYKQKRNNKLQNNENAMESGKQNNSEHREEKCTRVREKESDFDGSSGECHGIVKSTVSNAEDRMDSFSSGHEGVSYSFVNLLRFLWYNCLPNASPVFLAFTLYALVRTVFVDWYVIV